MMSTDLIGSQTYKLFNIIGPKNGMDGWYDILFQKKLVGKIHLETIFVPNHPEKGKDGGQPQGQPAAAQLAAMQM